MTGESEVEGIQESAVLNHSIKIRERHTRTSRLSSEHLCVRESLLNMRLHLAALSPSLALGRKNYLFAGSNSGGERAAAMYTLIGSAKLNGLDPEAYLRKCWSGLPTTRSTASQNCCRGMSPCQRPLKHSPRTDALGNVHLFAKWTLAPMA